VFDFSKIQNDSLLRVVLNFTPYKKKIRDIAKVRMIFRFSLIGDAYQACLEQLGVSQLPVSRYGVLAI